MALLGLVIYLYKVPHRSTRRSKLIVSFNISSLPPMTPIGLLSLIFILIQILFCASAQNITLGSTLSPSQDSKWVSPNGHFAFGFYPLTPTLYVLGVWFDSIILKTLAWTVLKDNKDIPVAKKSSLQLTESGLSLSDDKKNVVWTSENSDKVATAAMLDNGNFVLRNALFEIIWQSFDYPADTLLPGQTLKPNGNMFSKASNTNLSAGRFELSMQGDGNLVIYTVERRGDSDGAYWASSTSQLQHGLLSFVFDPSGLLYLVNSTNTTVYKVGEGNAGEGRFLRRVTLEIDGTFAEYVWNIDGNASSWSSVWQPLKDPCKDVKGQCGNNAVCRLTDHNEPNCTCPPHFQFMDSQDHFKGCMRSSSPGQSCSTTSTMSRLDNTDWLHGAETDSDYSVLLDLSEIQCQQSCLNDCMCVVVTYDNNAVCRKKRLPLIDGRQALEITARAFVKVSDELSAVSPSPGPPLSDEREGKTLVLIGIALLSFSAALLVAAFSVRWSCGLTKHKITPAQQKIMEGLNAFSYREIEAATGGFRQELGRGTFGKVYKGELPDGREIAVKNLLDGVWQGKHGERELRTEMSVIGTSHHKNLVQLYGFCDEGSQRLLVYEYMSNGSLDSALFVDNGFLDWRTRVQIAMGIARGLLYLHEECETQILHCDIKPQNILLDQNYTPKISDFGLAKLLKADQTATLTAARGTMGYIAPEWINKMSITVKVDVYSFGMMLLEIICCRKATDLGAPENRIILSGWVYECLKHGRLSELVEQQQVESEGNIIDSRQLERMVLVGLWCIQQDPGLRPYIKKVVQMMEGTVEIALPPAPGSFVGSLTL